MAKNDDKLKELLERAEQGIKEVFESDTYKNYLATMSKFHSYSFRNSLLILMQKPEATHIAGYAAWQKKFKRQVQRGEKGIQIIGYTPRKINVEQEKKDQQGKIIIGADGKAETEKVSKQIPSFTPVYVYDVSQTEGEPLPQLVNELSGNVEAYQDLLEIIKEVSPFPITFEDIAGGAKGYCDPVNQKIVIQAGMSEAQIIKTAIHEVTHADLHAPELNLTLNDRTDRRTREVEAESTAFVVCSHYGIDTSDYTFPYLATWSSTKELEELQNSLDTIQKQAGELIDKIDTRLEALQKDYNKEQPDKNITIAEMEDYGYKSDNGMLPIENVDIATNLFEKSETFLLYSDNTEAAVNTVDEIKSHLERGGIIGIESDTWQKIQGLEAPISPLEAQEKEFSIYQLKSIPETRDFRFMGMNYLTEKNMLPSFDMYDKIYSATLPAGNDLNDIFTEFNINRPTDFKGHSLSVSDIISIKQGDNITAHYIDSFGFTDLKEFAQAIEASHAKETLDSLIHDGDIDLDREKNREQLGFRDNDKALAPAEKMSMKDRIAAAKEEADRRNNKVASPDKQTKAKEERGE